MALYRSTSQLQSAPLLHTVWRSTAQQPSCSLHPCCTPCGALPLNSPAAVCTLAARRVALYRSTTQLQSAPLLHTVWRSTAQQPSCSLHPCCTPCGALPLNNPSAVCTLAAHRVALYRSTTHLQSAPLLHTVWRSTAQQPSCSLHPCCTPCGALPLNNPSAVCTLAAHRVALYRSTTQLQSAPLLHTVWRSTAQQPSCSLHPCCTPCGALPLNNPAAVCTLAAHRVALYRSTTQLQSAPLLHTVWRGLIL